MRRILKYLLPLVCIVAFCGNADDSDADVLPEGLREFAVKADAGGFSFSASESEFCIPRPTSIANTQRVQSVSRRGDSGPRHSFAFVKAGKVICTGTFISYQNNPKLFPSGLSESSHRLISLGKLII